MDLVLLDLRLPQGRGVELLRNLRQLEGHQPPVVVFSGTIASALEVRELGTLGVAGYVNEYTSVQHIVPSLAPHLFPDNFNRRSSPRAVLGHSGGLPVRQHDRRGAHAEHQPRWGGDPDDQPARIRVRQSSCASGCRREAATSTAKRESRGSIGALGMGAQFTWISEVDQAAIADFVQAHFFNNRKA